MTAERTNPIARLRALPEPRRLKTAPQMLAPLR